MRHTFRFREAIGDLVGGLVLIPLGVVWAITSAGYGVIGEGGRLAPGTVPFVAGVILAICGVAIAAKGVIASRLTVGQVERETEHDGAEAAEIAPAPSVASETESVTSGLRAFPRAHPVLSVYLIVVLGVLMMPVAGFSIAFSLAIFAILRFVERQRVLLAVAIAVTTALFGFVLFEVVFNLPLPEPFFL
jgi:putative tricarboxylic transport membrane protein